MTQEKCSMRNFVIYHQYSDNSAAPEFIYIGDDKSMGLDSIFKFAKEKYFDSNSLKIKYSDEIFNEVG